MALDLTQKQKLFAESYVNLNSDKVAAIYAAGYNPKDRNKAVSLSCQLMKNSKVLAKISEYRLKIAMLNRDKQNEQTKEFTKQDFIQYALNDYNALELTESNKPRFLELAGKGAGILGNNDSKPNQTLNLTQININGAENQDQLWDLTRKMLGNE